MQNNEELIRQADIQEIAEAGRKIYEEVKSQYESHKGKFLAIDTESKNVYMGETTAEAVEQARAAHPEKVFYVVKVGFSASEVLAALEGADA